MALSAKLKRRLEVALANRADAQELIAAVEAAVPADLSDIEDRLDAIEGRLDALEA